MGVIRAHQTSHDFRERQKLQSALGDDSPRYVAGYRLELRNSLIACPHRRLSPNSATIVSSVDGA